LSMCRVYAEKDYPYPSFVKSVWVDKITGFTFHIHQK
jgi:hypothetical protein